NHHRLYHEVPLFHASGNRRSSNSFESFLAGVFPSAIAKQIGDATNFMFVTPLLEIVSTGGFLILRGVGLFNPGGRLVPGCSLLLEEEAHGKEQPRLSNAWLVLSMTLFFPVTSA
ncbi:hypothetical protein, partial [Sphaerochaeta sp. UBA5836]|uniref:hypothetical protein n=1 Tax=Sphaerochaeta sp. UBA5836 TaxID=1947474 RepID=UPI0025CED13A